MVRKILVSAFAIAFVFGLVFISEARSDEIIGSIAPYPGVKKMNNKELFKKVGSLDKKADKLKDKAKQFEVTNPAKAARLNNKADKLDEKANNIKPSGVDIPYYDITVGKIHDLQNKWGKAKTPEEKARIENKINKLAETVNNQIVPSGLASMNNKYDQLTSNADKLDSKAASLDPEKNAKKIGKLETKAQFLRGAADWVKTKTESALRILTTSAERTP